MPIDTVPSKQASQQEVDNSFTVKHLTNLKMLQTDFESELVLCTQSWMHVSLQRYGHTAQFHDINAINKYIFERWKNFIGIEDSSVDGLNEATADKLFARMKQLQLQLQEVTDLIRVAESLDVIW